MGWRVILPVGLLLLVFFFLLFVVFELLVLDLVDSGEIQRWDFTLGSPLSFGLLQILLLNTLMQHPQSFSHKVDVVQIPSLHYKFDIRKWRGI